MITLLISSALVLQISDCVVAFLLPWLKFKFNLVNNEISDHEEIFLAGLPTPKVEPDIGYDEIWNSERQYCMEPSPALTEMYCSKVIMLGFIIVFAQVSSPDSCMFVTFRSFTFGFVFLSVTLSPILSLPCVLGPHIVSAPLHLACVCRPAIFMRVVIDAGHLCRRSLRSPWLLWLKQIWAVRIYRSDRSHSDNTFGKWNQRTKEVSEASWPAITKALAEHNLITKHIAAPNNKHKHWLMNKIDSSCAWINVRPKLYIIVLGW